MNQLANSVIFSSESEMMKMRWNLPICFVSYPKRWMICFFSLVDFSPVVCLEIGSRDDFICLNFSIKKVLCVLFFCCLDSRNKSTSRSCIFYFPHFCFTRFFARNCYFVLFRKFSLFLYFVFCLFGALADCLFPYIGKIVARSDYLARKLKIKATEKRTKRNKLKWNKHTANINVVQNYRFALNNLRNFIVLINFLPSDLRPRKNISHFHRIGIEKLLGSHFENWVCMMIESEYVRTFVCMYCGAATATEHRQQQ